MLTLTVSVDNARNILPHLSGTVLISTSIFGNHMEWTASVYLLHGLPEGIIIDVNTSEADKILLTLTLQNLFPEGKNGLSPARAMSELDFTNHFQLHKVDYQKVYTIDGRSFDIPIRTV